MALLLLDEFIGAGPLSGHTANTGQVWANPDGKGVVSNGLSCLDATPGNDSAIGYTAQDVESTTGKFYARCVFTSGISSGDGTQFVGVGLATSGAGTVWETSLVYFGGGAYWDDPVSLGYILVPSVVVGENVLEVEMDVGQLTGVVTVNGVVISSGQIRYPGGQTPGLAKAYVSVANFAAEIASVSIADTPYAPVPDAFWTNRVRCQEIP